MRLHPILAAAVLASAFSLANAASCTTRDRWTGPDKNDHAVIGLAIGAAATFQTRDPWAGFGLAVAAGAAKEAIDRAGGGACSWQDFAVTALAGLAGAQLGGLAIVHLQGQTLIRYRTTF